MLKFSTIGGQNSSTMPNFINVRRLQEGTWQAFERMIARFLAHAGFNEVAVVGGSGDKGADIVGSFKGKLWIIQAKCYSKPADDSAVNEVIKAQWDYEADTLVAVCNRTFTDAACKTQTVYQKKGFEIFLWDQPHLLSEVERLPVESKEGRVLRE